MSDNENQIKHFMAKGLVAQKAVDKVLNAQQPSCQGGELVKDRSTDRLFKTDAYRLQQQADRIEVLEKFANYVDGHITDTCNDGYVLRSIDLEMVKNRAKVALGEKP